MTHDTNIEKVVTVWKAYTDTIQDWQKLVEGVTPKDTTCGPVYELPNPVLRPNEDFAIADMRNLKVAEPHYHINGTTEIYIVLTGNGKVYVGGEEIDVEPGSVVVTPPETTHFTFPGENLVLVAINTPPFDPANVVENSETDPRVGFDKDKFEALKNSHI